MPQTLAQLGAAASGVCGGRHATPAQVDLVRAIFDQVGSTVLVGEYQMDAVTGLSGSGPAYIYTVIEALADGGVRMGLSREVALKLAAQTALGAARMVLESGQHPAILRDQVASPGGTTIAGLHKLEEKGLRDALISAVQAATERSNSWATMIAIADYGMGTPACAARAPRLFAPSARIPTPRRRQPSVLPGDAGPGDAMRNSNERGSPAAGIARQTSWVSAWAAADVCLQRGNGDYL
jgi:hypothetical protein